MEIEFNNLDWHYFKGNSIKASLLQKVCLFRSFALYDSGFRKNFDTEGAYYGDVQYTDFESYHIVASVNNQILGTVRITPSNARTVAETVLGKEKYLQMIAKLNTESHFVLEINRLMIDSRFRKLNLGRTLMYAAISLIEKKWNRQEMTIIGSAGNCTKQTQFFLNYTDYKKIENADDVYAEAFNDKITFLKYALPPYTKGTEFIDYFGKKLIEIDTLNSPVLTAYFKDSYAQLDLN